MEHNRAFLSLGGQGLLGKVSLVRYMYVINGRLKH